MRAITELQQPPAVWDGLPVPIRVFDSIIATALGGTRGTESLGPGPGDVADSETDGTIAGQLAA